MKNEGVFRLALVVIPICLLASCNAFEKAELPDEAVAVLEDRMIKSITGPNYERDRDNFSYKIASAQKSSSPNNIYFLFHVDEVWCVTVNHNDTGHYIGNNYLLYRIGLSWDTVSNDAGDFLKENFLKVGCTNYVE